MNRGGSIETLDMFNHTNNIPSTLSVPPLYLSKNEKVTLNINIFSLKQGFKVFVREPSSVNYQDINSNEGDYIDYYFIYSPPNKYDSPINIPSLDGIIQGYRLLTGEAPLYELPVFGFWQCKQRYHNQDEVLSDASEYRNRGLPVDGIVQDWQYWGDSQNWGPQWNPAQYENPGLMIDELHAMNFYFMISVWSKFGKNATCLQQFLDQSTKLNETLLIEGTINSNMPWFDPYNSNSRALYYQCIKTVHFDIGVDAIWLDATEPEYYPDLNQYLDNKEITGNAVFDPYSLYVTTAVQDGLNMDQPNKRVFHLTRSSFGGQQRTGGAIWSGDTTGNWDTFRRQIVAATNFQLSGTPYWSQDIGGFFRPSGNCNYDCDWYRSLLIRWFQFGAFCPIFRVHGNNVDTAYWNYGETVLNDVLLIDNLRYRLLPYIYTVSYWVTKYGYTLQRGLVLDFPDDINVYNKSTQYMFGPNLLVSPVYKYDNTTDVYFPVKYNTWYCFWTGKIITGGTYIQDMVVPLAQIPLYVKEGSIIILGPFTQYAFEKYPWNELEIRIYPGSDGTFELYNDDGKSKNSLEMDQYILIQFNWNDSDKTMTINNIIGSYNGMSTEIIMNFVIVSTTNGIGVNTSTPDKTIIYNGTQSVVKF